MKVSVIIPTYNRHDMVRRAVESVINQTVEPYEIIVVDDGSTDSTQEIIWDDSVRSFRIPHSGFPGFVRNYGVDKSVGDYISFLDSDDIWHPNKLEEQLEFIKRQTDCKVLHTKEKWIMNGKTVSQKKRKHKREGFIFKDSLQGCIIGPSTVLIKRDIFQEFNGFDPTIEVGEDYDLWLRITNKYQIHYIDKELITKYAGHGDQLSFKYGYIEPFKISVLERLIERRELSKANQIIANDSLKSKYDIIINGCLKRGKYNEADSFQRRKESFLEKIKDYF